MLLWWRRRGPESEEVGSGSLGMLGHAWGLRTVGWSGGKGRGMSPRAEGGGMPRRRRRRRRSAAASSGDEKENRLMKEREKDWRPFTVRGRSFSNAIILRFQKRLKKRREV